MNKLLALILLLQFTSVRAEELIKVISNDWLVYNRVPFQLIHPRDPKTGERKDRKPGLKDILKGDQSWEFYPNTGYISSHKWYFNRDSVYDIHNGSLILIVKKPGKDQMLVDTLSLQFPHPMSTCLNSIHIIIQKDYSLISILE